ncbi:hypothetical protein DFH11DRAFT_1687910 [Phellopilus nigrolimitatus]|nr:hypothetical protein DFH11DRAFT_1687910 [Phellopilus nigrolimitatus]
MPHKRAKRSIREQSKGDRKLDLPPSQAIFSNDDMPRSMARVLNAESIQNAWREKKRALALNESEGGEGGKRKRRKTDDGAVSKTELKIKPGESLKHFRRRVEDDMRPVIRTAMKNTTSVSKQKSKASQQDSARPKSSLKGTVPSKTVDQENSDAEDSQKRRRRGNGKRESSPDFALSSLSSAPKRLNDVVLAPPELKPAPRLNRLAQKAKTKSKSANGEGDADDAGNGVVSAAQKRMMELEREKAITRYRALKEAKLRAHRKDLDAVGT